MIDEKLFLNYTHSFLEARRLDRIKPIGLENPSYFLSLQNILSREKEANGEINVSDFTKLSGMAMPNAVRMLNELQMEGLITRRRESRNVFVRVTEKGHKYYEEGMCVLREKIKELIGILQASDVTDDEVNEYMRLSLKIHAVYAEHFKKED